MRRLWSLLGRPYSSKKNSYCLLGKPVDPGPIISGLLPGPIKTFSPPMNQSSDAAFIKLLHDTLTTWLKYAKELHEVHTSMDQLEESIKACTSLAWIHHVPIDDARALTVLTVKSLKDKLQNLNEKEAALREEFGKFSESFERKLPLFLACARVHGQAPKNMLPGPSGDSYTHLVLLTSSLQECLNRQSFFLLNAVSNARHEGVKFLDDKLANDIQQAYTRFRSA